MTQRETLSAVGLAGALLITAAAVRSLGDVAAARITSKDTLGFQGVAERVVESDRVKWSVQLLRMNAVLKTAEEQLSADRAALLALLKDKGIQTTDVSVQPAVSNVDIYSKTATVTQTVVIESDQVGDLTTFQGTAGSAMAARGATFSTLGNEFTLSTLNDVEKELAREALTDAQRQAEQVPGIHVGPLQNAGSAGFMVTPVNSGMNSYYYGGYGTSPDTQSIKKKITATMYATYYIR